MAKIVITLAVPNSQAERMRLDIESQLSGEHPWIPGGALRGVVEIKVERA